MIGKVLCESRGFFLLKKNKKYLVKYLEGIVNKTIFALY
jgi:hypothetical protein